MSEETTILWQEKGKVLLDNNGTIWYPPQEWCFVARGDAALTRRLKKLGEYFSVCRHYRNRIECLGLWCPKKNFALIRSQLEEERLTPQYLNKLLANKKYRQEKQLEYKEDFCQAVITFLHFHPKWQNFAKQLAEMITQYTIPIGSGTVARTKSIPLDRRAEAAVIAWMRHQTTAYEKMKIAHVKGKRREVRRDLAQQSRKILSQYRNDEAFDFQHCPLFCAVQNKIMDGQR